MKRLVYCIVLINFLCSCSESISYKEMLADSVMGQFKTIMKKQENMMAYGTGGSMMDDIERFYFGYQCPKIVTIEEARSIAVRCTRLFLELVNQNEEIRPYLHSYPFPPSGLELDLKFMPCDSLADNDRIVHTVFVFKGKVYYKQNDPGSIWGIILLVETYEEACLKVESACL